MVYEEEIKKVEKYLKLESNAYQKIKLMDSLRYFYKENEKDKDRIVYKAESDSLEYSKSINIAIEITKLVPQVLEEIEESKRNEIVTIMKNNYYYLAGYLFSYYVIAIEFGIPPEKQFFAPRTSVLGPISKKLDKFYYKPKAVMTISMPQGTGKEQPLSSKILTPEGWITMGEVKVGTKVIGADGKVCNVTGVFPKGIKDVYRVTFDDHTYVDCGLEHLWEVKTTDDRRRKKDARVVNTQQMLNNYILGKNSKRPYHNYSVRLVEPIEYGNKLGKNDLKPYLLGALIGDGGLSGSLKFTSADAEMLDRIRDELPITDKLSYYEKYDYGIKKKKDERNEKGYLIKSTTLQKLEEYGLNGKTSEYKFIPKKYLYTSVKERLDLLRGLMDTDGWTDKRDCNCEFCTVSQQLCYDMLELVRGLGGKASFTTKQGRYKDKNGKVIKCKTVYRVNISININPFYLKRKAEKYSKPQFNYQKIIVNIEKVRQEKCQCIMIDHPEHLYITDGYTLTHNTELGKRFMSFCIGKEPDLPNMMVSYSATIAKDKFYQGEMTLIEDENENFQKIFPKLKNVLKSADNMTLDYRNDEKKKPHSEYTLYCCGFDGGITGRTRAHNVLYIDDLIKNIEEARNKDVLDKKWEEFTATLKKRMQGNCKMLIIGTIFSINDPLSRIIKYYKDRNPDRIEVVRVPRIE